METEIIGSLAQISTFAVQRSQWVAEKVGVEAIDLESIEWLLRNPNATAGALGKAMGLTSGAVTGLLRRLTTNGFVQIVSDELDKRKIRVNCIPEQIALRVSPHYELLIQRTEALLKTYGVEELSAIARFLKDICLLEEADLTQST